MGEGALLKITESFISFNEVKDSFLEAAIKEGHVEEEGSGHGHDGSCSAAGLHQDAAQCEELPPGEGAGARGGDDAGDRQWRPQAGLAGGERVGGCAPQEAQQGGRGCPWLRGQDAENADAVMLRTTFTVGGFIL